MRFGQIFTNRFMALAWAAGIIWFAIDFASPGDSPPAASNQVATDVTGAPVSNEQAKEIESIINGI